MEEKVYESLNNQTRQTIAPNTIGENGQDVNKIHKARIPLKVLGILIVAVLFTIIVATYRFSKSTNKSNQKPLPISSESTKINNNVQQYNNQLFGFSFNYPKDYEIYYPAFRTNHLLSIKGLTTPSITPLNPDTESQTTPIPNFQKIDLSVIYYLGGYDSPVFSTFEELKKEKDSTKKYPDGSNITTATTIKKITVNGVEGFHKTIKTIGINSSDSDREDIYYFDQNGYLLEFISNSTLDSAETKKLDEIIQSIKFFKPTQNYTQPYDILKNIWEKGTQTYSFKNISFEYPKSFIIKNETYTLLGKVVFYSRGYDLTQDKYFEQGFDYNYYQDNQFRMYINYDSNSENISLENYLKSKYGTSNPKEKPAGTPPTTWEDFHPSDLPTPGSYTSDNHHGNESIKYYFLYKNGIYSFDLLAIGDLGASNSEEAKLIYNKIIKSIKFN